MNAATSFAPLPWTAAQRRALLDLCRHHGVEQLWVFKSAVSGTFDPARSDLDLQARFRETSDPRADGAAIMQFWLAAEALFARSTDLLTVFPIRSPCLRAEVRGIAPPDL